MWPFNPAVIPKEAVRPEVRRLPDPSKATAPVPVVPASQLTFPVGELHFMRPPHSSVYLQDARTPFPVLPGASLEIKEKKAQRTAVGHDANLLTETDLIAAMQAEKDAKREEEEKRKRAQEVKQAEREEKEEKKKRAQEAKRAEREAKEQMKQKEQEEKRREREAKKEMKASARLQKEERKRKKAEEKEVKRREVESKRAEAEAKLEKVLKKDEKAEEPKKRPWPAGESHGATEIDANLVHVRRSERQRVPKRQKNFF